jgi:hypothetical protein
MTASAFGFARPIPFSKLEKGMLVLAAPSDGQRYFGVISRVHHDMVLVILASSDGDVPGAMDIGYLVDDLWHVPGILEIEPDGAPFAPAQRRSITPGYAIDSDGNVAAVFHYSGMGRTEQFLVNLSDGEHLTRADKIAFFKGARFFVRQEGRRERFAWPDLTPER